MKLISGSSNLPLSKNIAEALKIPLVETEISKFPNGEKRVWIKEDVRGENIVLVQSLSDNVDELIIETLLLIDALERLDVDKVNLVIPWLGYSLQDKVFRAGEPISAKVIASILSKAHVDRIFLLDLHNNSIPGFFSVPTNHFTAIDRFANYVKEKFSLENTVIASPDFGGLKRARVFADKLGLELVNIDKQRSLDTGEVLAAELSGNVKDKNVILFDDVIVSGGTVVKTAKVIKNAGAKSVHFLSTHGIFANNALEKIKNSNLDSLVITNSIYHPNLNDKIVVLDSTSIFVQALKKWL